jgi:hypothetical protein
MDFGMACYTQEEIAKAMGMPRRTIAEILAEIVNLRFPPKPGFLRVTVREALDIGRRMPHYIGVKDSEAACPFKRGKGGDEVRRAIARTVPYPRGAGGFSETVDAVRAFLWPEVKNTERHTVDKSDRETVSELRQSYLELRRWEKELPEGVDVQRSYCEELYRDIHCEIEVRTEPGKSLTDARRIVDEMKCEENSDERLSRVFDLLETADSAAVDMVEMHLRVEEILDSLTTDMLIDGRKPTPEQIRERLGEALALLREGGDHEEG